MKKTSKSIIMTLLLVTTMVFTPAFSVFAATNTYKINNVSVSYTSSSVKTNCWTYAREIYKQIWGYEFSNNRNTNDNMLREIKDKSNLELTESNLKKYVSAAAIGSVLRTSNEGCLFANSDNVGHSQIIVKKDNNGFTVFESNIGSGSSRYSREKYYTWSGYVNSWYNSNHKYIKYIKWSGAKVYSAQQNTTTTNSNTSGAYFPKCASSQTSIVNALKSIGVDSSYNYRKQIAAANGISNYSGTAAQNTSLLNKLKAGTLKNPSASVVSYFPKCASNQTSIVNALKSVGADSSYNYRKQIAAANGISNYSGTASQNTSLLNKLKAGNLIKP